jgi:hypothetical protein
VTLTPGVGGFSAIRLGDATQNPATPTNTSIDIINGPSGVTGSFVYNAQGASSVELTLNRISSASGVTVPMILTDDCGDWRTFAGAGSAAFGASGSSSAVATDASRRAGASLPPGDACTTFANQAAAQAFLRENPTDPRNMDKSRNGIACEPKDGSNPLAGPTDTRPVARR